VAADFAGGVRWRETSFAGVPSIGRWALDVGRWTFSVPLTIGGRSAAVPSIGRWPPARRALRLGETLGVRCSAFSSSAIFIAGLAGRRARDCATLHEGARPAVQRVVRWPSTKIAWSVFPLEWTFTIPSNLPRTMFPK